VKLVKVLLDCDKTSAINLTKNTIQHSKTKHIEIRDHVQIGMATGRGGDGFRYPIPIPA